MKKQRKAHLVEVKNNNYKKWEKRIAVDLECNPVLCVDIYYEEKYLNFEYYDVERWEQWREIKEPEYITYETMKTLDIFEYNKKDKTKVNFDEIMYSNGTWDDCNLDFDINLVVKLNYKSIDYNYFLYQNDLEHVILRNKK